MCVSVCLGEFGQNGIDEEGEQELKLAFSGCKLLGPMRMNGLIYLLQASIQR